MKFKVVGGVLAALILGGFVGSFVGMALAEKERAESADAALLTAHQSFESGNYDAALESAFAAVDRRPHAYAGYEIVADIFSKSNDLARARVFYGRALQSLAAKNGVPSSGVTAITPAQIVFEKNRIEAKVKALGAS
jgi:Tfp pilus assembly protein PilF